nr:translation initiation factor IF-2-like [Setaria viridis]
MAALGTPEACEANGPALGTPGHAPGMPGHAPAARPAAAGMLGCYAGGWPAAVAAPPGHAPATMPGGTPTAARRAPRGPVGEPPGHTNGAPPAPPPDTYGAPLAPPLAASWSPPPDLPLSAAGSQFPAAGAASRSSMPAAATRPRPVAAPPLPEGEGKERFAREGGKGGGGNLLLFRRS